MKKLGQGTKSEVFLLPDGRILKLALPPYTSLAVEEARILAQLATAGVHAPRVAETMQIDGRFGLVFENMKVGETLSRLVQSRPWRIQAAGRELAMLHTAVHACTAAGLASQRERLEEQIRSAAVVPSRAREMALEVLGDLPDADTVCHNDLHMLNVIAYSGGVMIIDWALATRGSALADVATAILQLRFGELHGSPLSRSLLEAGRALFSRAYVRRYHEMHPDAAAELACWELPAAVALAGRREGRMRAQLLRRIDRHVRARRTNRVPGRATHGRPGVVQP